MRIFKVLFVTFFLTLLAGAAPAAASKHAPDDVARQTPEGARSLHFQEVDVGPGQGKIFCHVYQAGAGYFLDVFRPKGNDAYFRLNSVNLGDTPHSQQLKVSFMWLQPQHYSGPILRLHDQDFPGEWDGSQELLLFPDGYQGRVVHQTYLEKSILGTVINPSFDCYDERGLLVVTCWEAHEGQLAGERLFWNGQGFVARKPRYAVIGPLLKTQAEARDFLRQPSIQNSNQVMAKPLVHPSRYYQARGLKPGYIVVVLRYAALAADAEKVAGSMKGEGISCSVLQLY